MTTDITTVWHCCTPEQHRDCLANDRAAVSRAPIRSSEQLVVWELHVPQSVVSADTISWTEAMRWPYQITTK